MAYFLRWKRKHVFQMLLLKILDIGEVVESALIIKNSGTLSIESIHNINHQTIQNEGRKQAESFQVLDVQ